MSMTYAIEKSGSNIGRTESDCHLSRHLWRGLEFVLLPISFGLLNVVYQRILSES